MLKLKAVYKLIPPDWYDREVTEENMKDLHFFLSEELQIENNRVFVYGRWRSFITKLKGQASDMAYVRIYRDWLKVFYTWE